MRLSDLNEQIRACGRCRLSQTRMHALCGEGDPRARLMLVAQAPGRKEDLEGAMFIGPSGRVLDDLLGPAGGRRIYPLRHPSALLHNRSLLDRMELAYKELGNFL